MKLRPIIHNNNSRLWCGPAAISAVTGKDTRTTTQCIRSVNNLSCVMGTEPHEIKKALNALGLHARYILVDGKPTLARWGRQNRQVFAREPIIVGLTEHWVVLCGRRFVDSITETPVLFSKAPSRRARVEGYFLLTPAATRATLGE
jgi:hypothetical protein